MKISIITAVYNNAAEVATAIDSVLSQTYQDVEYIIIDGGSDDGTQEIIASYGNRIARVVSEPDRGIYDALNKGILLASGEIVGFLHSDDMFDHSGILEEIASTFTKTGCDATYGDLEYVSKNNPDRVIRYWKGSSFDFRNFRKGWMPAHPTLFLKRSIYSEYGLFDPGFRIASDYDFMLRTLARGRIRCEYMPLVITRMRLGGASNKSLENIWRKSYEDWKALRKNSIGGCWVLFRKNASKLEQFVKIPPKSGI